VRLHAAALEYADDEYIGPGAFFRVSRKGRNSPPVLNAFIPIVHELPLDTNVRCRQMANPPSILHLYFNGSILQVTWQCFQKVNHAWRPSIIKGNGLLCEYLESKNKLHRMLFEYADIPPKCPVKKVHEKANLSGVVVTEKKTNIL